MRVQPPRRELRGLLRRAGGYYWTTQGPRKKDDGVGWNIQGGYDYEFWRGTGLGVFIAYHDSAIKLARPRPATAQFIVTGIEVQHRFLPPPPAPPPPPVAAAPTPAPVEKKRSCCEGVNFDFDKSTSGPTRTDPRRGGQDTEGVRQRHRVGRQLYRLDRHGYATIRRSLRRATSVRNYLERARAGSRTDREGVRRNESGGVERDPEGRAQNRRVELIVNVISKRRACERRRRRSCTGPALCARQRVALPLRPRRAQRAPPLGGCAFALRAGFRQLCTARRVNRTISKEGRAMHRSRTVVWACSVVAGAALLALASCGDDNNPPPPNSTTVDISLQEFSVTLDQSTASVGDVTFHVTNNGKTCTRFLVIKTDLPPGAPANLGKRRLRRDGPGADLLDEIEDIDPGDSKDLTAQPERRPLRPHLQHGHAGRR